MKIHLATLLLCSTACAQMSMRGGPAGLSSFTVENMHETAISWFVGRPLFGIYRVAPPTKEIHFDTLPLLGMGVNLMEEIFRVKEMQLIGIAKHDPPVAFVLENSMAISPHRPSGKDAEIPPMGNMKDYKTRSLTDDERRAIATLEANGNQEVVVTGQVLTLSPAPVVVVGPIRATKSCLDCHDVKEGELLGAFSYTLEPLPNPRVPVEALPPSMRPEGGR
jgi:hypothetical protein